MKAGNAPRFPLAARSNSALKIRRPGPTNYSAGLSPKRGKRSRSVLQDPARPWEAYSCTELRVPKNQSTQLRAFCVLDQSGSISVRLGGTTEEFRLYHGVAGKMEAGILLDDCELVRQQPADASAVKVWDAKQSFSSVPDWPPKAPWQPVLGDSTVLSGAPVFQARQLAGSVRENDGALLICAVQGRSLKERTALVPSPPFTAYKCAVLQADGRTGLRVTSGDRSYTAWLTPKGLVSITASNIQGFRPRIALFAMAFCRLWWVPIFVTTQRRWGANEQSACPPHNGSLVWWRATRA